MSTPKERPILFKGKMVRAILDGRKTQTRRIMQVQPPKEGMKLITLCDSTAHADRKNIGKHQWAQVSDLMINEKHPVYFACPYGRTGDRLWVRETFATGPKDHYWGSPIFQATYKSMEPKCEGFTAWKPSIHMPRWASRITLEITEVRVQRLQEITEEDAKAEGAPKHPMNDLGGAFPSYRQGFQNLWDSINSERGFSWDSNPYVWAISFKVVAPTPSAKGGEHV